MIEGLVYLGISFAAAIFYAVVTDRLAQKQRARFGWDEVLGKWVQYPKCPSSKKIKVRHK